MTFKYNDPAGGTPSSAGSQIRIDAYERKALIEKRKDMVFSQMSNTKDMPKHMGKAIKKYHYLPILDDANINDQGIDASGATDTVEVTITITKPDVYDTGNGLVSMYAVGEGANAGAALTAARANAVDIFKNEDVFDTNYATTKTALEAADWTITEGSAVPIFGNMYGSSKDVGYVSNRLPRLTEDGGVVNGVGTTRIELESTLEKFGFHSTYTRDSMNFDTDADLLMHINREMINAAVEIYEDTLQMDLLASAGIIRFGGDATSTDTLTGEAAGTASLVTYNDLVRLAIDLDDNRTPKQTQIIKGVNKDDTRTINSGYIAYIGSELLPVLKAMKDFFNERAFIEVAKYAAGTEVLDNEVGAIDDFRFVVYREMMHWAGVGATVSNNGGYRESGGKYNAYPILVVGAESFTTIGFQSGKGGSKKFRIVHRPPGTPNHDDPYEETGYMSISWFYGTLIERPERIGLIKTVAPW